MCKLRLFLIFAVTISSVFSIYVEYQLKPGWQLVGLFSIGLPVEIADFLPIVPPVYSYNTETGSYEEHTEFPDHLGLGFWAFSEFDTTVVVPYVVGVGVDSFNLAVSEGWNLLAVPGAVRNNRITDHLPATISTNTFEPLLNTYDNISYFPMLNKGFWLYSDVDTSVMLTYQTHDLVDIDTGRALAEDIQLGCYRDNIITTVQYLDEEGYILIPNEYGTGYCSALGFYKSFFTYGPRHSEGSLVKIDMDPIPDVPYSVAGYIICETAFFGSYPAGGNDISIRQGDFVMESITESGRFFFESVPEGLCTLTVTDTAYGETYTFEYELLNTEETDYYEFAFDDPVVVGAPNLYIYPETTSVVDVSVEIANGFIVESEPLYEDGWSVNIDPEGWINGREYGFLYYDYLTSESWQTDSAWIIEGDDLVEGVTEMLESYGVTGREIPDFFDYWLPRIPETNYVSFYPQPDSLKSVLSISPTPDSQLQLLFLIHPSDTRPPIPQPHTPTPFTRTGFTVVEWGGVLVE